MKAISRVAPKPDPNNVFQINSSAPENSFAFFNVNKTMVRVKFDEVTHIESMREYVYINTETDKVITKIGIGEMEKMLNNNFLRVHRSYIINLDKITAYNAEEIFIKKLSVPIGTNYKKVVESSLQKKVATLK
jgi:DNA-binding LytR/AlgR family response regulator